MARTPWIPPELTRRPITLAEARAAGLTRKALRGRAWKRLSRGLYRLARLREDPLPLLLGWQQMLPEDAVFSGLTAAWLHGLDADPLHPVEVTVPTDSGVRSRKNLAVRHRRLATSVVTTIKGLRVTIVRRTFAELRIHLPRVELLVLADAARRLGLGCFDEFAEPAESPMETRLRWLLLEAGLPRAQVQVDLRDHDGTFVGRADLYYPASRLAVEYDGANHRERLVDDNRRQNRILAAGYELLRFTAPDLAQRPDSVVAQVRRATMTSK